MKIQTAKNEDIIPRLKDENTKKYMMTKMIWMTKKRSQKMKYNIEWNVGKIENAFYKGQWIRISRRVQKQKLYRTQDKSINL